MVGPLVHRHGAAKRVPPSDDPRHSMNEPVIGAGAGSRHRHMDDGWYQTSSIGRSVPNPSVLIECTDMTSGLLQLGATTVDSHHESDPFHAR